MPSAEPRVLSIQSHVVSGYVGNKSACFPLQVLGFEVDTINSVQFSNHTEYKQFKGHVLDSTQLADLMDGLKLNNLDEYSHLLTGYVGSKSFLMSIQTAVKHLKSVNPDLIYVCDPVMGDDGKFYVPEELLPVFRENIIPLADIVTPNQFEAEMLSGKKITDENDAAEVMDWFHDIGVKTVVLSSTDLGTENELVCLASSIHDGSKTTLFMRIPRLPFDFRGTGDLFAALLLGWMYQTNNNLKVAMENTVATMQSVLELTVTSAMIKCKLRGDEKPNCHDLELRLLQSVDKIRHPEPVTKAKHFSQVNISH